MVWPVRSANCVEGVDQQRRRAADEEAHAAARLARQRRLGEQAHVQRRHAHEDARPGQLANHRLGVEAREPEHPGAGEQRAVRGDEEAVDVEDRQRVDQHVAAFVGSAPAPVALQRLRVRQQVAVAEHRALAAPGRAAGVEDRGQVVAVALGGRVRVAEVRRPLEQAAAAVVVEREDVARAGREGELGRPDEVRRPADDDRGLGVADEVADLVALVGGVERQVDVAGAQHREVEAAAPRPTSRSALRSGVDAGRSSESSRLASIAVARSRSRQV